MFFAPFFINDSISSRISFGGLLLSLPRTYGTMQYEQKLSQPSIILTKPAWPAFLSTENAGILFDLKPSRQARRPAPCFILFIIDGILSRSAGPHKKSTTGSFVKISSFRDSAMHPI